ncbi:MAG: hypothetical protein DWH79_07745 [Planctomycetota bacterium]|nr:MAG: hypothetical protein DWH79_07745 [Planctomycetota bacterium]
MTTAPHNTRPVLGIVFALDTEADAFASRVQGSKSLQGAEFSIHEGNLHGQPVAWVVCGAGMARAQRAARALCDGHQPLHVLSAGFAGGLDPSLPRGSLVTAAKALREGELPIELSRLAHMPGTTECPEGIVTVDAVVTTAAAKQALKAAIGARFVDMETYAVARVASGCGIPCLSLRVVSDAAGDELPADIARLVAPQSAMRRVGAALAAIGRKPTAAATLWRLWEHAVVDGRTLADGLEAVCRGLPVCGALSTSQAVEKSGSFPAGFPRGKE